jgi:hypothetical protein
LGPLGTVATNRPTVPAPGDYDDGEIGGMDDWQGKPAPVPLCPPQTPHACPDAYPGRRGGKPTANSLSYGTASGESKSVDATCYNLRKVYQLVI